LPTTEKAEKGRSTLKKIGDLKLMFNPKTVALIGASEKEGSVGRAILENLILFKNGKIFPVNPPKKEMLGLPCYSTVTEVPEAVHLAVIATPALSVPGLVEECGKKGVHGVIVISAGFKEIGEEGEKLEKEIKDIQKRYRIRMIGPNCLGIIRPGVTLNTTFSKVHPEPGNIAFISQSGALGGAILDWAINNHIGFSLFASLGSMLDVDFGDLIDFLGDDEETRSIILYMEGIGNAKKFMSAARGFAQNKPIVVIKSGRFSESAQAAHSHTGAMAGDDEVYDAAFKRVGVVRVDTIQDLFDAAAILDSKHLPRGPSLAMISNAGGPGVMATDALIRMGGKLATLSKESLEALDSILPKYWSKANPVDLLGDANIDRFINATHICLNDSNVDGLLVIYVPQAIIRPEELARSLVETIKGAWKPVLAAWIGGSEVEKGRKILRQNNVPTYETPEEAIRTYHFMYKYKRNLELLYETPSELPVKQAPPKKHLKEMIRKVIGLEGRTLLSEIESKSFLSSYGIPTTEPFLAKDTETAVQIARRVGYPVVLKIVSPDITHKTEVGGVILSVNSDQEMEEAYRVILNNVKEKAPGARIEGVSIQRMIKNIDYEVILGAKKDRDFGSVVLFGMGGIGTEILRDYAIGLPPLNQTLAKRLMEETQVYKMLQGYRGKVPADLHQMEEILVSFSNLIVDFPEVLELDLNPIAISNSKAIAIDARIIVDKDCLQYTTPYPHLVITPYPTRYIKPWQLSDGTEVLLRPIRPEDEPIEREMLSTLSEETLRMRFFRVIREITHEMLVRFCNIDYDRDIVIVAEIKKDQRRQIIGVGRVMMEHDLKTGEIAVLVHDAFQGKGLGYKLMEVLISIAKEKGLEELHGIALTENVRILRMVREFYFTREYLPGGETEIRLKLR
jgi:acetyltransferase